MTLGLGQLGLRLLPLPVETFDILTEVGDILALESGVRLEKENGP